MIKPEHRIPFTCGIEKKSWPRGEDLFISAATGQVRVLKEEITASWENTMPQLVQDWKDTILSIWQSTFKIEALTQEVLLLKDRITRLETESPAIVPIDSLEPDTYEIIKTIHAVVRLEGNEFTATFYDANISASGDTDGEAVINLKDMIIGTFEILSAHERMALAPSLDRQLQVLSSFIREKDK
ncbi:MAG: hypothetical protein JSU77_02185 [Fidelibacterota bacterium]|nr:MAG: hypothetical protein JSU77_02185 [Candidatus Neomarinimicrobiota bacterium]